MFWNKKTSPVVNQIDWREAPGCFERHLQRRYNNPLFSSERRNVSADELKQARAKDDTSQKEFAKIYGMLFSEANRFNESTPINDLTKCLQDTQNLLELGAAIGGDLQTEFAVLETLEGKLIDILNGKLPQGADMLKQAHSLSVMARIPYLAQSKRPDTPILKNEELPAILSEDLESIRTLGFVSRSFPDFKPNGDDVKKCLDEAVKNGLDTNYAKEVLEAWNSQK
jgi:hypothetical protein